MQEHIYFNDNEESATFLYVVKKLYFYSSPSLPHDGALMLFYCGPPSL
jgi:hypothetical protein